MGLVARERAAGKTASYRLSIVRADGAGEPPHWRASVPGLPGCVGEGETPAAAIAAAEAAALLRSGESGNGSAEPAALSHSGRLLLRMPKILHAELAGRADAEQVSLNQLIVGALADAAAGENAAAAAAPRVPGASRLPRAVRAALAVNAIVLALALAAVLLIVAGAWHPGG